MTWVYMLKFKKVYKIIICIIPILLIIDLTFGKYSMVLLGREFSYLLVRNFAFVDFPYFIVRKYYKKIHKWKYNSCPKYNTSLLLIGFALFIVITLLEKYILIRSGLSPTREHYISTRFYT